MDEYSFDGQYAKISGYTQETLLRWVLNGRMGGHFISAVLNNDLKSAFANADDNNAAELKNIVMWLHNQAPACCWGHPERVKAWQEHRGLEGLNDKILEKNG